MSAGARVQTTKWHPLGWPEAVFQPRTHGSYKKFRLRRQTPNCITSSSTQIASRPQQTRTLVYRSLYRGIISARSGPPHDGVCKLYCIVIEYKYSNTIQYNTNTITHSGRDLAPRRGDGQFFRGPDF